MFKVNRKKIQPEKYVKYGGFIWMRWRKNGFRVANLENTETYWKWGGVRLI